MSKVGYSRSTAAQIVKKYSAISSEKSFDQSFWRDILGEICRIDVFALVRFQHPIYDPVSKSTKSIDGFWPGVLLIEHKSRGKSLDAAEIQARKYLTILPRAELPSFIIVSDFARFRIVDVLRNETVEFALSQLPEELHRFEAIVGGHHVAATQVEISADRDAAHLMGGLFSAFEESGYEGHATSVFLVRILFLVFAEDTGLIGRRLFSEVVASSPDDGTGLGAVLEELFVVLNMSPEDRPLSLSDSLKRFPYVNGGLFAESLPLFSFDREMRSALLATCDYDWSSISPAIFGSLFQAVRDPDTRKEMGEHFTSAVNIRRVISNLFLAEFKERFEELQDNPVGLRAFRNELGTYRWLDPAGGSGNFLIVTYQEMRALEHSIIERLQELDGGRSQLSTDGTHGLQIRLEQFYGIEIDEWSSAIARVGMFLADHQLNLKLEALTGSAPNRLPLVESPTIVTADALEIDWESVCPVDERTFIMGNPPFVGAHLQTRKQKDQTERIWGDVNKAGSLDYVSNWFRIASELVVRRSVRAAFVASKSITQGEQPPIMWQRLNQLGAVIDFAHQSFRWTNGARKEAAVHVVIIGMSDGRRRKQKHLWMVDSKSGELIRTDVDNINAYLLNSADIFVTSRTRPLVSSIPPVKYGSKPTDGGYISNISPENASSIRQRDPIAAKYLRQIVGAQELIYGEERYCLWLVDAEQGDFRRSPELLKRLTSVRDFRLKSKKSATRELALTPALFEFNSHPDGSYMALPLHSSSDRKYIPFAYLPSKIISTNALSIIPDAPLWLFGAMSSRAFVVWTHAISGRLGDGIRIAGTITYNNFPFPPLENGLREELELGATEIIGARAQAVGSSLADLYDDAFMPIGLRKAHERLDRAMADAFGSSAVASEADLLELMFGRYVALASSS